MENNTTIQPDMVGQQPTGHIIKLSTSTKVLYSLFNFFAPVAVVALFVWNLQAFSLTSSLVAFLSIGVGLFCLLYNLRRYNRFLWINGKTLQVCRGKQNEPEVLETISVEDGITYKLGRNFKLKYNDKSIQLLDTYVSTIGIICVIGKFVWVPFLQGLYLQKYFLYELYQALPQLFKEEPKKVTSGTVKVWAFMMWLFTIVISMVGLWGVVAAPFYAFMTVEP